MADGLILLVGDDHGTGIILGGEGYQLFRTESPQEALILLDQIEPDLILLDFDLPGLGALDTLQRLRGNSDLCHIGVMTLGDVPADLSRAFAAGADEFMVANVADPLADHELIARAQHLIARKRELDALHLRANYDALTGLLNRGAFMERLERLVPRLWQDGSTLSCIMVDVDRLKLINDHYGHRRGDEALRQVAEILHRRTRATDMVGRYGGDEFVLALPETGLMGAVACAKRLRDLLSLVTIQSLPIGVSFGVAQTREGNLTTVLERADQALYHGKHAGGNQVSYEHEGSLGFAS